MNPENVWLATALGTLLLVLFVSLLPAIVGAQPSSVMESLTYVGAVVAIAGFGIVLYRGSQGPDCI